MTTTGYRTDIKEARLDIFCPNCNKVSHHRNDCADISGLSRTIPRLPGGLGWHPTVGIVIITCSGCITKFWTHVSTEEDYQKIQDFLSKKPNLKMTAE